MNASLTLLSLLREFRGQFYLFSSQLSVSSVTGGKQMIPILNALNVHVAVFGNHDFGKCYVGL